MRKRGFTLAEILISLGIIGVVAATVLPTFISSHKTQVYDATRKTVESSLENAFTAMMVAEMAEDLSFTKVWADNADLYDNFSNYFKSTPATSDISGGVGLRTKAGVIVSIKKSDDGAEVRIDTNGSEGPNKKNVDFFEYDLDLNAILTRK